MSITPIKGKLVYKLLAITVLFAVLGGVTVSIINSKLHHFDKTSLKNIANEKNAVVNKELESLNNSFKFLGSLAEIGEIQLLNTLIQQGGYRDVVAGYVFVDRKSGLTHNYFHGQSSQNEIWDGALDDNIVSENEYFLSKDGVLYALWQPVDSVANIHFVVNIQKLNERFWNEEIGQSAYVEVYDSQYRYIIGVDSSKIGKMFPQLKPQFTDKMGKTVLSDFLGLDVRQYSFESENLRGHTLLISVPILKGDEVFTEVSLPIWGLWFIGLLAIFILVVFTVRQDRKQYNLQMRNLQFLNEKTILEYSNLKEKMNPHFLFNSLGSLQQLIQKQPDIAKTYVVKLSKFYRKLLNLPPNGVSTLQEELDILQEYIFLQQLRFGDLKLPISYAIDPALLGKHLPTLSLQILVENVIKHNILSDETPVNIEVTTTATGIYVSNTKNLRQDSEDSEGYGTNFLQRTYQHYRITDFHIEENADRYSVYLPFIDTP
ncbi:sensor histidine kinase [Sphingobacterium sp. SGL-16]|uniref:sensor histidine kinase n=1 Tax=Sphingobacterium sp. SGL-16 TaxID=2710883 RepID=UPI0019D0349F|nr:histidine kinase [Sphingobacterium sp. SGL-16]